MQAMHEEEKKKRATAETKEKRDAPTAQHLLAVVKRMDA